LELLYRNTSERPLQTSLIEIGEKYEPKGKGNPHPTVNHSE